VRERHALIATAIVLATATLAGCTTLVPIGSDRPRDPDGSGVDSAVDSGPVPTVCSAGSLCPDGYYCARTSCDLAASGTCRVVPTDCSTIDGTATCGCDQVAYRSACELAMAGQSLAPGSPRCGACNRPDVTITAGCGTSLGWGWDGESRCLEYTGCACAGECDRLESTPDRCISRYATSCGDVFPCGSTSCMRHAELCTHGTTDECAPAPAACGGSASCPCLVSAGLTTMAGCVDDGAGGVSITRP
jgi:hypothetical protein